MDWTELDGVGRCAYNAFSPSELETATGLTADMQRVWRRRGHLPARDGGRASFDAREAAAIAVRLELARFCVPPSDTIGIGDEAAGTVLYSALLSRSHAAEVRGPFDQVAKVAANFAADDRLACAVSGADASRRYLWGHTPSELEFTHDIGEVLFAERFSAMLVLDLTVIGVRLAERAPKPLFLVMTDFEAGTMESRSNGSRS